MIKQFSLLILAIVLSLESLAAQNTTNPLNQYDHLYYIAAFNCKNGNELARWNLYNFKTKEILEEYISDINEPIIVGDVLIKCELVSDDNNVSAYVLNSHDGKLKRKAVIIDKSIVAIEFSPIISEVSYTPVYNISSRKLYLKNLKKKTIVNLEDIREYAGEEPKITDALLIICRVSTDKGNMYIVNGAIDLYLISENKVAIKY